MMKSLAVDLDLEGGSARVRAVHYSSCSIRAREWLE